MADKEPAFPNLTATVQVRREGVDGPVTLAKYLYDREPGAHVLWEDVSPPGANAGQPAQTPPPPSEPAVIPSPSSEPAAPPALAPVALDLAPQPAPVPKLAVTKVGKVFKVMDMSSGTPVDYVREGVDPNGYKTEAEAWAAAIPV